MKSTAYYVPVCQRYICTASENALRPSSSDQFVSTMLLGSDQAGRLDPYEAFTAGKLRILESSINQVLKEIEERERLREALLEWIDREICAQKELLYQVAPNGSSPYTVGDAKRRSGIEKTLSDLEGEKRREQSSAWRDISGLKKELRELQREFEEEKRKQQVMVA